MFLCNVFISVIRSTVISLSRPEKSSVLVRRKVSSQVTECSEISVSKNMCSSLIMIPRGWAMTKPKHPRRTKQANETELALSCAISPASTDSLYTTTLVRQRSPLREQGPQKTPGRITRKSFQTFHLNL